MSPWLDAQGLAKRYWRAHVVLAPTRTWVEQFGRMVVEAQTAGAVVVGYASGALPEVVGQAGVLVPEGDVLALDARCWTCTGNPSSGKPCAPRACSARRCPRLPRRLA